MISMTKNEIAKYLRDYSILSELIRINPKISVQRLFQEYVLSNGRFEDNNGEYFIRMVRCYGLYNILKIFSYCEDLQIDRLSEDNLQFDEIKEDIFVNKEDSKYFSKKLIIKFIRNAFNHSEGDKELYKISKNGRYLEVNLSLNDYVDKNGNRKIPVPFHIKINIEQLEKINRSLIDAGQNLLMTDFVYDESFDIENNNPTEEIKKVKFRHYYFNKKIPIGILDKLSEIGSVEDIDDQSRKTKLAEIESIIENEKYNVKLFSLDEFQQKRGAEYLSVISDLMKKSKEILGDNYFHNMINYCLSKLIPLGMYHYEQQMYEYMFSAWYIQDFDLNFEDIKTELNKISFYNSEEIPQKTNVTAQRVACINDIWKTDAQKQLLAIFSTDSESRLIFPLMMYVDFAINNLSNDEYLVIQNQSIPRERIRNSLAHGRWYISCDNNIEFYDCPNGNENDYNFDFHVTLNVRELQKAAEEIYEKSTNPLSKKISK